jgi:ABC-type nickel/cobalt efflux system permease component RcnA
MGVFMLRGAVGRHRRRGTAHAHVHVHVHGQRAHAHDHAALSDEAHARLHLADVQRAVGGPPGSPGRGVSSRSLLTLGVSGGLAPCPDALAILLLAVGINQLALGMLAILAFSLGLAGVLVGFGLAVALAGPVWSRFGRVGHGHRFGRLMTLSPVLSGAVVVLLGVAMVWRASTGL